MTGRGFAGRVLRVDLTAGRCQSEPLDMTLAEKFAGGLGLTIRLAANEVRPGVEPLAPENAVVLGVGPLVGTEVPSSSRLYSVTVLPASGTLGWCGAGGVTLAAQLKQAGFDHIVITGRSARPAMLRIEDGRAELVEAGRLWGLGTAETARAVWESDPWPAGVLTIGPAGENRSSLAMAYVNRLATLGRGGLGAVLGAKNLKAVLVRGHGGVEVHDQKRIRGLVDGLLARMRNWPQLAAWHDLGMINSFPFIPVDVYREIKLRRVACVSCPIGCKDVVRIRDGRFAGFTTCSSSAINLFTPVIYGFKDYREAVRLVAELDEYGLDMFEFFGVMKAVSNLVEQGTIPAREIEPPLVLDSFDSMSAWAGKTARREGLGQILADGFKGLLDSFGAQARPALPALVKNMHPYTGPGSALPWDLFGTMELGQVLDPRGPHVGSGGSPTYFAKRPLEVFPGHLQRMGVPDEAAARILDNSRLDVGRLLKYSHTWFAALGCLGLCARAQINRFYSARLCADIYQAVTGFPGGVDELRLKAERAWNLLRLLNLRLGFDPRNLETPPDRWFQTPGFKEYVAEQPLNRGQVERMIEDYYDEWGWDLATGAPKAETLARLGLTEYALKKE
ncbi:MAG: aldehyde ferredoxin oxidoreductase N-terminal domain-containing protein [Thermodesulfobacteriota bacterium]